MLWGYGYLLVHQIYALNRKFLFLCPLWLLFEGEWLSGRKGDTHVFILPWKPKVNVLIMIITVIILQWSLQVAVSAWGVWVLFMERRFQSIVPEGIRELQCGPQAQAKLRMYMNYLCWLNSLPAVCVEGNALVKSVESLEVAGAKMRWFLSPDNSCYQ